jgi:xylan 1,4-beta-xylosidase
MRTPALITCGIYILLAGNGCSKDTEGNHSGLTSDGGSMPASGTNAAAGGTAGSGPSGGTNGSTPVGSAGSRATAGANSSKPIGGSNSSTPDAMSATECPPLATGMDTGPARVVVVDAQQVVGTIRSLQGAHFDPGPAKAALSNAYVDIGVDAIQTHDAGGVMGSGSGDVDGPGRSRMVPSLTADPAAESSYNFGPTDTLLENIRGAGSEIWFRVGRSNITNGNTVPPDYDKYAEFVKHIVMHYNQGWANGFMYGIHYYEIWNEPDFLPFWIGTPQQFYDLYKKLAVTIKAVDADAIVGGPGNSSFNDKAGMRASLLQYIKDNQLPLDFYSFHKYTNKSQDPMDYARMALDFRAELDKFGFNATKVVTSEFYSSLQGDVMLGGAAGSAAFMADALIYLQNGIVDRAAVYMQVASTPTKENRAFGAISKFKATPSRLCAQGGDDNGFGVMAGLSKTEPMLQVVIANYQIAKSLMGPIPGGNEEALEFPGVGHLADLTYLDRRTFDYPDKDGYALTIKSIPESWGDVTVKQYRIDARNDFADVNTKVIKVADRPQGSLTVSGAWARATASTDDPEGAEQGVDLIVVTGATASSPNP